MKIFSQYQKRIKEGDWVLLYFSPQNIFPLIINRKDPFHNKFIHFYPKQLIDQPYGQKFKINDSVFVVLHASMEFWSLNLNHRTQIVYPTDMSLIILKMGIQAGKNVIESGTGSGSFTHALSQAVGSTGKVYTFEYHPQRYQIAKEEFTSHGLENVEPRQGDVCSKGFPEELNNSIDAVFLDLPEPWKAIPNTIQTLKKGTSKICCFSPCIEQVQKTVQQLYDSGFREIQMEECLERQYEVQSCSRPDLNAFLNGTSKNEKKKRRKTSSEEEVYDIYCPKTKGHTAFLTFATFYKPLEERE